MYLLIGKKCYEVEWRSMYAFVMNERCEYLLGIVSRRKVIFLLKITIGEWRCFTIIKNLSKLDYETVKIKLDGLYF